VLGRCLGPFRSDLARLCLRLSGHPRAPPAPHAMPRIRRDPFVKNGSFWTARESRETVHRQTPARPVTASGPLGSLSRHQGDARDRRRARPRIQAHALTSWLGTLALAAALGRAGSWGGGSPGKPGPIGHRPHPCVPPPGLARLYLRPTSQETHDQSKAPSWERRPRRDSRGPRASRETAIAARTPLPRGRRP